MDHTTVLVISFVTCQFELKDPLIVQTEQKSGTLFRFSQDKILMHGTVFMVMRLFNAYLVNSQSFCPVEIRIMTMHTVD